MKTWLSVFYLVCFLALMLVIKIECQHERDKIKSHKSATIKCDTLYVKYIIIERNNPSGAYTNRIIIK